MRRQKRVAGQSTNDASAPAGASRHRHSNTLDSDLTACHTDGAGAAWKADTPKSDTWLGWRNGRLWMMLPRFNREPEVAPGPLPKFREPAWEAYLWNAQHHRLGNRQRNLNPHCSVCDVLNHCFLLRHDGWLRYPCDRMDVRRMTAIHRLLCRLSFHKFEFSVTRYGRPYSYTRMTCARVDCYHFESFRIWTPESFWETLNDRR